MQGAEIENLLATLLDKARAAGADAADVVAYRAVASGVSFRMGALEDVERSESIDLGLRILCGRRQATVSTTDLEPSNLAELATRCAAMAKAVPEDPYCGLAPRERLAAPPFRDLDLGDYEEPGSEALSERAKRCEEAALAVERIVNSSGAGASYSEGEKWIATSDGFLGRTGGSGHSVSVSVIARDENGMERDYDFDSKTHLGDLQDAGAIGRSAGERAARRLSPRKLKSRAAPVIFDERLASSLISSFTGAANGGAVARGVTFLKGKLGERIFPETITLRDDPHAPRGKGSRPFDGEGVENAPFDLVKDGRLTQWYLNSAQARQLGLETNARARRGGGGPPGSGPTNITVPPGDKTPDALRREIGDGLLVTDMFGPQINANTGDYSVGCAGFWCEAGEIAYPVSEITIAGNLLEMYANIVPANDLALRGAINSPSLLVGEMTIAGD